jgi:tRNA-Thr(GGU) m(6)t(6)A37 methyltransferase TsaA
MELQPIGTIHSPFREAQGTPIQPRAAKGARGTVEVFEPFAAGLRDLDGFERVWLLYQFDRAAPTKLVVTPFLDSEPRGVFATRAPCRPNRIGMSSVRLLAVRGNVLEVEDLDVLDGTPLLDLKPYVPQFDCYEAARCGWLDAPLRSRDGERAVADDRFCRKGNPPAQ